MQFRAHRAHARHPVASSGQAPKEPKSWRWYLRLFLRLVGYGLLGLAALAVIVFFVPWSLPSLDRYLQERWRGATGLPLSYQKATFYLSRGSVVIKNPTILDPQSGQPLLEARRIRIEAPIGQFLIGKPPYAINNINVETSTTLDVNQRKGQWELGHPWDRVLTLVREQIKRSGGAPTDPNRQKWVGLHHLQIGSVDVHCSMERGGAPLSLIKISNASIDSDFQGTVQPQEILINGFLTRGDVVQKVRFSAKPNLAREEVDFRLNLNYFDSFKNLPVSSPVSFHGQGAEVVGLVGRQAGGRWMIRGYSSIEQIDLTGNDAQAGQSLGATHLAVDLWLDPGAGRIELNRFSLENRICVMETSGTVGIRAPFPYTLNMRPLRLQGQALALLADALGYPGILVRPGEAVASVTATLQGDFVEKLPKSVFGQLHVTGLNLHPASHPPFSNIQLQAEMMTSQTLVIKEARAVIEGIPVEIKGQIKGPHPLIGQIHSADLTWKADGSLRDLTSLVSGQQQAQAKPPLTIQLSGKAAGEGRVHVMEPLKGTLTSVLNRTRLEGELNLEGVRVNHPSLPAPIQNVKGKIVFLLKYGAAGARFRGVDGRADRP